MRHRRPAVLPRDREEGRPTFRDDRIAPRKASTARVPPRLREIAPLVTGTASVPRTVKSGFKLSVRRGFDFVINGERHQHAEPVNVGELQAWDVVNVPPKATVRIAWCPDNRPGMWMYHCHILEHHAAGMVAHFEVKRP